MSKRKNYKVVVDDLNLVLFVKGFSLEEERILYNSVRVKFEEAKEPISIEAYKEFIVKKFLIDSAKVLTSLPSDNDDKIEAMDTLYASIVGLYPPFSIEFICQDLNTATFFSDGAKNKFLQSLREKIGPQEESPPMCLSSLEDLMCLEDYLKENIVGQRGAIESVIKALKLMASGLAQHSSFLFVGPTGVGKTQLGKLLGHRFSGNFYKINCAEYAGAHEYAKLIGSPPGYVGHTDKSLLAEKAEESNRWVFLFDEIEKAHHKLYDFLLSLLDDGTCTDNMGQVLDFTESIFIFTSNQGLGEINRNPMGFDRGAKKGEVEQKVSNEVIRNSVKKHFSPEFLNRLDDFVLFNSLTKPEVKKIAKLQLQEVPITPTEPLLNYIVEGGFSSEYGARNISRFIKQNVSIKVADAILNKLVPKEEGAFYTPRLSKGEVRIINTRKYEASS